MTSTPAVGCDLDLAELRGRDRGAVISTYVRHADPEQLRVAALAAGPLLGPQLVVAGDAARLVERLRVLTDVVVGAGDGRERERARAG